MTKPLEEVREARYLGKKTKLCSEVTSDLEIGKRIGCG